MASKSKPFWRKPTYRDPALTKVLAALGNEKNAVVARRSGISTSTLRNWRKKIEDGGTRCPQHVTMEFALHTVGKEFVIAERPKKNGGQK